MDESSATRTPDDAALLLGRDRFGRGIPARGLQNGESSSDRPRILLLSANPADTARLSLDEELRDIRNELTKTLFGRKFDLDYRLAATFGDLAQYLLEAEATVVHFAGHGNTEGIALEDESGHARLVPTQALRAVFALPQINRNLRLVVLNSCFSEAQAGALAESADAVIGMASSVPDATARSFATGLYMALGSGVDVAGAFKLALAQVMIADLSGVQIPAMLVRAGIDPTTIQLLEVTSVESEAVAAASAIESAAPGVPGGTATPITKTDGTWQRTILLDAPLEVAQSQVERALAAMNSRKVSRRARDTFVARFGGWMPAAVDATEEMVIVLAKQATGGTEVSITSRSVQLMLSDWGRNDGFIKLFSSLLGIA